MVYLEMMQENKKVRENRPLELEEKLYSVYENNGVLQICFKSRGCINYLNGACIMCDYGVGVNISKEQVEQAFDLAIANSHNDIKILLLNTYGSILDVGEMSDLCFDALLMKVSKTNIRHVIFETHYSTITREKLILIKERLAGKIISFELGFETSDEKIRKNNLLKKIDNKKFIDVINLIHSFDMLVLVNLLVGIPFLNSSEQLSDALNSIKWCSRNGVDEIDLFPINVKPYTFLMTLYKRGEYDVISQWLLIEVLNRVEDSDLEKIYLAWYGNREMEYENGEHSILPKMCNICCDSLGEFYLSFLSNNNVDYRRGLIRDLLENRKCDCYRKLLVKLKDKKSNK